MKDEANNRKRTESEIHYKLESESFLYNLVRSIKLKFSAVAKSTISHSGERERVRESGKPKRLTADYISWKRTKRNPNQNWNNVKMNVLRMLSNGDRTRYQFNFIKFFRNIFYHLTFHLCQFVKRRQTDESNKNGRENERKSSWLQTIIDQK